MKKEFSVNLLLLLGLNLLVKPLYIFGIDVQVQNTIGPAQYGLFFSIFNFTLIFQILLEFGITNLVKRDISETKELASKYFSNLIGLKIILVVIYVAISLLVGYFVGYDHDNFKVLSAVLCIQILLTFVAFIRAMLAGIGAYRMDSLLSVMDKVIMIVILSFFLYTSMWGAVTLDIFLAVYILSVLMTFIISFFILARRVKLRSITFRKNYIMSFIQRAMPYALITFLMGVYGRIDAVFLERLLPDGDYQAGVYAAGFRLLDAYMMFALLFANLLLPMLARYINERAVMMNLLYFVLGLLMTASIIGGIGGYFYKMEIGQALYRIDSEVWGNTLGLLMLCMIPIGMSIIMGVSIISLGKLRKQNVLFFGGVLVSVSLNIILIPLYKSTGAALAALIVNSFIAIGQLIIFYVEAKIKINIGFYLRIISFILITILIFYIINQLEYGIHWLSEAIAGILFAFVVSIFLGLIPRDKKMFVKLFSKA